MTQQVKEKVDEINKILREKNSSKDLGLMHGYCGESLFKIIYSLNYGGRNEVEKNVKYLLTNIDSYLKHNLQLLPYSIGFAGLPGIFWTLSFMKNHNFAHFNSKLFFSDYEALFDELVIIEAQKKNYDYFYGIIGILLFYNEAGLLVQKVSLQKKIISILEEQLVNLDKDKIFWNFLMYDAKSGYSVNTKEINLGLSHGLPSLISCILLFDKSLDDIVYPLVNKSINFIISCQVKESSDKKYLSQFPYTFNISDHKHVTEYDSRLAWCYGDLGIANVLWNAGDKFKRNDWKDLSYKIITKSTERQNLVENKIFDAGICHGSSGVAHLFNKFYIRTNDQKIKDARNYWIAKTMELSKFSNGTAGYLVYDNDTNNSKQKENGFLQGISGIGLVLLGYLNPKNTTWDRCLLI